MTLSEFLRDQGVAGIALLVERENTFYSKRTHSMRENTFYEREHIL